LRANRTGDSIRSTRWRPLAVISIAVCVSGAKFRCLRRPVLLANIVRTDCRRAPHPARQTPSCGGAIRAARAQQRTLVWGAQQIGTRSATCIKGFYPARLVTSMSGQRGAGPTRARKFSPPRPPCPAAKLTHGEARACRPRPASPPPATSDHDTRSGCGGGHRPYMQQPTTYRKRRLGIQLSALCCRHSKPHARRVMSCRGGEGQF